MQLPFEKVLHKIGIDDIKMFLMKIKAKRNSYTRSAVKKKIK
jgi:hypothetical protein